MNDVDVCIVGAGPVGLTLALDLSRRGVRTALVERELAPGPWPKMERCNARSMEIFRRLGVSAAIRAGGQPAEGSMSVAIVTRLTDAPLAFLDYPTVARTAERIAATDDGSLALEPYQLISQYTLEPILRRAVAERGDIETRFGWTFERFSEGPDGVVVGGATVDGPSQIRAKYLVGCDGGASPIRKQLDIGLEGQGGLGTLRQVFFRSDGLLARIPIARARHYWFADAHRSAIIVQDDGRHFSLHSTLPADADFAEEIRLLAGYDVDVEVLHVGEWTMHLLVAESYGRGRVLIAGDAAHLVIPTGGLGMNTGVGDATDLAWKLAATVQGWGGPGLLAAYDLERRAVGRRNRDASGFAAAGLNMWRNAWRPNIRDDNADGAATRAEVGRVANIVQRRSHEMIGIELGYTYAGSPIVSSEPPPFHESENFRYLPSASPGSRFPHVWLSDGRALQDLVGDGFTLLDFGASDIDALTAAVHDRGAPMSVLRLDAPAAHRIAGRRLVLLRPDLHVAWRGDELPDDCADLAARITGHAAV